MEQLLWDIAKQMPFVGLLGFLLWRAEKKNDKLTDDHSAERTAWRKELSELQENYNAALLKGITAIEVLKERLSK